MLYRGSVTKGLVRASMLPFTGISTFVSLSLRAWVFHPNTRRHVRLLGPCFKTGRLKPLCQHPKHKRDQKTRPLAGCAELLNPSHCIWKWAITHPKMPHSQRLCPVAKIDADLSNQKIHQAKARLISSQHDWLQAFPFQQFHVLFNSLSKVLFIFPSRYLFAIGLSPIFSFRWHLPPILSCIPKQLDSSRAHPQCTGSPCQRRDSHPPWCSIPEDLYTVQHG